MGTGPPFFAPDTPFGSLFSGGSRFDETATHSLPAALHQSDIARRAYKRRSYAIDEYYRRVVVVIYGKRPRNIYSALVAGVSLVMSREYR